MPFQVFVLNVLKNNVFPYSRMFHVPDFIDGLLIKQLQKLSILEKVNILLVQRKIGKGEENYDT